jgi:hypothetical protein
MCQSHLRQIGHEICPASRSPPRLEKNEMPKVASQDYRDAMAYLGAGVDIVTTDGRAGRAGVVSKMYLKAEQY